MLSTTRRNPITLHEGTDQYMPTRIYPSAPTSTQLEDLKVLSLTQEQQRACKRLFHLSEKYSIEKVVSSSLQFKIEPPTIDAASLLKRATPEVFAGGTALRSGLADSWLERTISNIEDYLTSGAAVPILGVLPAGAKVVLGAVQTVAAVATSFFAGLASIAFKGARPVAARAVTHIAHGLGNIVAGALEAIPLVGTISWTTRYFKKNLLDKNGYTFGQNGKFLAYKILTVETTVQNPSGLSFWLATHTMVAV